MLPANHVLTVGSVSVDLDARRAWTSGQEIFLTATEFNLLLHFMRHPDQLVTRRHLEAKFWPEDKGDRRVLDVYIRRLRQKMEVDPAQPVMFITCRGDGYMLVGSGRREQSISVSRPHEAS
jgi:DNA-binding response OmpR family regulator